MGLSMSQGITMEEASILEDVITKERHPMRMEITHHVDEVEFSLLDKIHPIGEYKKTVSDYFYFHVKYSGVEFTYFCNNNFDGEI